MTISDEDRARLRRFADDRVRQASEAVQHHRTLHAYQATPMDCLEYAAFWERIAAACEAEAT